jgi:alkylation response protein AidB-like acyl-CoA dehydrogenase
MQYGAVLLCAQMVGADQKLLELTVDYAKTRVQFEQPIGINQYVQEHCVMLLSELDSSWWLTYYAAWKLSEGKDANIDVAMAKGWISDSHERACWRAHQVHGGVGYTINDGLLPLMSRRGKSLQLNLGDTKHHLEKVTCELEKWPEPAKPKGKPMGMWEGVEEQVVPYWFDEFAAGKGMADWYK